MLCNSYLTKNLRELEHLNVRESYSKLQVNLKGNNNL